jgi:hypothetical protein
MVSVRRLRGFPFRRKQLTSNRAEVAHVLKEARVFRKQGDELLTSKLDVRTKSILFRPCPQVKGY